MGGRFRGDRGGGGSSLKGKQPGGSVESSELVQGQSETLPRKFLQRHLCQQEHGPEAGGAVQVRELMAVKKTMNDDKLIFPIYSNETKPHPFQIPDFLTTKL